MGLRQALYEVLFPHGLSGPGEDAMVEPPDGRVRIGPYGFLKFKPVGRYRFRLDPGDRNDRYYYFGMVGHAYDPHPRTLLLREGDTVIDVGANVGNFSAVCAAVVGDAGKVHAIEANPVLVDRLADDGGGRPGRPHRGASCGGLERLRTDGIPCRDGDGVVLGARERYVRHFPHRDRRGDYPRRFREAGASFQRAAPEAGHRRRRDRRPARRSEFAWEWGLRVDPAGGRAPAL